MTLVASHPAAVPGIAPHRLFERARGESTWILGVTELDRYLVVPEPALPAVLRGVEGLDGTRAPEQIREEIRNELGQDLDVEDLVARLKRADLLQSNRPAGKRPLTNSGLLALDLLTLPLGSRSASWLMNRGGAIAWFSLLAGATLVSSAAILLGAPLPAAGRPSMFAIGAVLVLSIVIHEVSHMFAAAAVDRRPRSVTFALFLAQIPMVYLTIPGIFTLSPGRRIWIWSAGCLGNAAMAVTALALTGVTDAALHPVLAFTAAVNVALIKLNLIPFLPTDGYYIASTLLKEHNVRKRAMSTLWGWCRGRNPQQRLLIVAYALVSAFVMVRLIFRAPLPALMSVTLGGAALLLVAWYRRRDTAATPAVTAS